MKRNYKKDSKFSSKYLNANNVKKINRWPKYDKSASGDISITILKESESFYAALTRCINQ